MPTTRIQVCGRIAIELEGLRLESGLARRQSRLLFVYLVLNRSRLVARDELTTAIWPEEAPPTAEGSLRVLISRLRRLLGAQAIEGRSELRLVLPTDAWIDVEAAARRVHEAEAAVHTRDWSRVAAAATVAFTISDRGFLPGETAPWVVERQRWLEDVRVRALECDGEARLGIGGSEIAAAERVARRVIVLAPYRESGYRLLMEALARRGNTAEALLVYEHLRQLLKEELGTAPSAASRTLHRRLLAGSTDPG